MCHVLYHIPLLAYIMYSNTFELSFISFFFCNYRTFGIVRIHTVYGILSKECSSYLLDGMILILMRQDVHTCPERV